MIMMMKDHHVIVIMVKRSIIRRVRGEEGVEVEVGVGVIASVAAVVVEVVTRVLVEAAADLDMTRRRIEKEDTRVAVARIVSITAVITRMRKRRDITRITREIGIAKRGKRRTESMIGDIMMMTILITTVIIMMMITR